MKVPERNNKPLIKRLCFTFALTIFLVNVLSAQNISFISKSDLLTPLFLIISQDDFYEDLNDSISNLHDIRASFLLVNASLEPANKIIDTVNYYLNGADKIDKSRIYLVVVGDKIFFERENRYDNKLFPSSYYIQTDNQRIDSTEFKTVHINEMDLDKIIHAQLKFNLWQFDLDQIRKLSLDKIKPNNKSWEVGVGYSKYYPGPVRTDDDFPEDISAFEVQISRNINEKYKIWSSLAVNKIMLGQKKKADEMAPLDLDLDKQIMESVMFSRSLNLTRIFYVSQSPGFKPYMSLGFSHTQMSLMYAENKGNSPDMEMKMYNCGSLMLTSGLEINLAEKLRLNVKTSYHISLNTYNTMNNFNTTFGLGYVLQRKEKPFYEYLRQK